MQKNRRRIWLLGGAIMAIIMTSMVTPGGCGPTGISREQAIEIAVQAVQDDGVMSLDDRDAEVVEEETYWHVYFPYTSDEVLGGEPHVWVSKSDGDVIQIYYTQ